MMTTRRLKEIAVLLLPLLFFLVASLALQDSNSYYENADYKKFLTSMLQDHDFNIVNQGNPDEDWLVTQSFFHPSFHTESSSPFLLLGWLMEKPVLMLTGAPGSGFRLGFALLNFLFILGGIYSLLKAAELLKLQASKTDLLFFLGSTAFLYFSIFLTNVLEVYSFFLISFLLLEIVRLERGDKASTYFVLGIIIGFASLFKPLNAILLIPFLRFALQDSKQRWRDLTSLLAPVLILLVAETVNRYLKFSQFENPMFQVAGMMMSFDPVTFFKSVSRGYFGPNGMFLVNVSYLLGLIGLLTFFIKTKKTGSRTFFFHSSWIAIYFISYLASPTFFLGHIIEDHLPGRILINTLPFLFLGYCYLLGLVKTKYRRPLQIVLLVLSAFYLLNYFYIDSQDTYAFPERFILNPLPSIQFFFALLESRLSGLSLLPILLAGLIFTVIVDWIRRKNKLEKFFNCFMVACFFAFILMTTSNLVNSPGKIRDLQAKGFFAKKSIASGPEAYAIDYVLDLTNTFYHSDEESKPIMQERLGPYFKKVSEQIKTDDAQVKEKIANQSLSLSFWVRKQGTQVSPK